MVYADSSCIESPILTETLIGALLKHGCCRVEEVTRDSQGYILAVYGYDQVSSTMDVARQRSSKSNETLSCFLSDCSSYQRIYGFFYARIP